MYLGSFFCPVPEMQPTLAVPMLPPGPPTRQLRRSALPWRGAWRLGRLFPKLADEAPQEPGFGAAIPAPRLLAPKGSAVPSCRKNRAEAGDWAVQRPASGWGWWGAERPGLLTFIADVFIPHTPVPEVQSHLPPLASIGNSVYGCSTAVLAGLPTASSSPTNPTPIAHVPPLVCLLVVLPSVGASLQGFPRVAHAAPGRKAGAFPRTSPGPAGLRFAVTHSQPTLICTARPHLGPTTARPRAVPCVVGAVLGRGRPSTPFAPL